MFVFLASINNVRVGTQDEEACLNFSISNYKFHVSYKKLEHSTSPDLFIKDEIGEGTNDGLL